MNDIVTQNPNANVPADPAQLQDYYRSLAEAYAATERSPGNTISVRNGVMSLSDQPIPGNQFAAVIMDSVRLNTYYPGAFDASEIVPPTCYAIGRTDAELMPHPDMAKAPQFFQPQADRCNACPHNQFGTGQNGKGKACTNRRRLIMLLAGTYNQTPTGMQMTPYMDAAHYETTPLLQMHLPPTSIKGWGEFVRSTAAQYQRPPQGLVTRVYIYAHPKHGKEAIGFEALGPTPDPWFQTLMNRAQEAAREISQGYEAPQG